MRVISAWCEAEGKPAVVREKEPLEDPEMFVSRAIRVTRSGDAVHVLIGSGKRR
jgi:hypothetical protein